MSPEGVPTVQLVIGEREWSAAIDTGFNGDVELPEALRQQLSHRYVGQVYSMLAGGRVVGEDSYFIELPFDGETMEVAGTFAPIEEILIGTRLLRDYRLEIHFVEKSVLLERAV